MLGKKKREDLSEIRAGEEWLAHDKELLADVDARASSDEVPFAEYRSEIQKAPAV